MNYCEYNSFFKDKSALVTGGAGFIGSHLTQHLATLGCRVRVLDDFSTGHLENIRGVDTQCIEGSILEPTLLSRVMDGIDVVFHLAASVSVPESIENPQACFKINVDGTRCVIEAACDSKCKRIVFASSAACYGSHPQLPSSESDSVSLESPYAESKWQGEQLLADMYSVDGVSLRYFNVFGDRQDPNSQYAAVVSAFKHSLQGNRKPIIYGDGSQTRDFTAVENVVHANLLAASHQNPLKGAVFNVGTGSSLSLHELLYAMVDENDVQIIHELPREGDVQHSRADISAIASVLGYTPVVETKVALRGLLNPTQL